MSHRGVAWAAGPKKRIRQGSEWAVHLVGPGPRRPKKRIGQGVRGLCTLLGPDRSRKEYGT